MELLLSKEYDNTPEFIFDKKNSIIYASKKGYLEIVKVSVSRHAQFCFAKLISKKCDNSILILALIESCKYEHLEIVVYLIEYLTEYLLEVVKKINNTFEAFEYLNNNINNTLNKLLKISAKNGYLNIFEFLIEKGANINILNKKYINNNIKKYLKKLNYSNNDFKGNIRNYFDDLNNLSILDSDSSSNSSNSCSCSLYSDTSDSSY